MRAAAALLAAAMSLPPAHACLCWHFPLGGLPTNLIKIEDPEPLPDAPVTLQPRVTPQDRVMQSAPGNADAAPPPAPGLLQQAPAPPPHLQQPGAKKGTFDTPK